MRPRIKLDKTAIMIDYATHTASWLQKRHGVPCKSTESFYVVMRNNGITKAKSKAYVAKLKAQHARSLEAELAKPTLLKRLAAVFSGNGLALWGAR